MQTIAEASLRGGAFRHNLPARGWLSNFTRRFAGAGHFGADASRGFDEARFDEGDGHTEKPIAITPLFWPTY